MGNQPIENKPDSSFIEVDLTRLKKFLPVALWQAAVDEQVDPSSRLRSKVITQLSMLLEATTSHLPASLVEQVQRNPVAGQAGGRFVQGTLLFADISGFTAMSERLSMIGREGAEEVTAVVNRYFDVMLTILKEYKGELIRFGGDALLGLFEEGQGRYNSATQAAQAAVKMQAAMGQFAQTKTSQGTFSLQMSVGVHRGLFFAAQLGSVERMEYALFGADVNATAAIESAAMAGQIMLDEATFLAIDTDLLCTAVPSPEYPQYRLLQYIDLPPLLPPEISMDTHFPLAASLGRIRRTLDRLEALTPYLPAGLLARLISDPRASSLKGEHRLVANLFANVDGLGEMVEALGAERGAEIVAALNFYFMKMAAALRPYGGVINKMDLYDHGDKLMVIFGAPVAHEDDAERAVRAALAMQTAFAEVAAQLPLQVGLPDLAMQQRIGISYGYVFAGYVGSSWRHEYTVMGDEVNLAARLMSAAAAGDVVVSENVHRHVQKTAVVLEPRGAVRLKGKSQPAPIFAATGLRQMAEPMRDLRGMNSPLVGREAQWKLLADCVRELVGGNGRIVTIIGEAGVGKSRLARDLFDAVQNKTLTTADIRWVSCRSLSYTESVTFAPMQEMLQKLLGVPLGMAEAAMMVHVRQALAALMGEDDAESSLPYVANFLNLPLDEVLQKKIRFLDGQALQQRTFVALRMVIASAAGQRPLILFFDDMHWMDHASLDLLEYLMPMVRQIPLVLVLLMRPEREKGCWQMRRSAEQNFATQHTEIGLYGLSRLATQQMLLNLIPVTSWPPGVADLILNRVEGNPLYLEEVVRSLMNDGLLTRQADSRWQFSETVTTISVPDTLEGVLMARLDRLEELCRWTVQVAAVVGRSFPEDVLSHTTTQMAEVPMVEFLTQLQLVEIIRQAQQKPEVLYAFIHSLMQEVSYGSLAVSARREYHRHIAQYLEDSRTQGWERTESLSALIAHHAYEGEDWPRALRYQMQAGQQALNLFANQEAVDHYQKALACVAHLPAADMVLVQAQIHLALGRVYIGTGQYELAEQHMQLAYEQAVVLGDHGRLTAVCRWYARMYEVRGEYPQALEWIERGLGIVSERDTAQYAQILLIAGLIAIRQGDYDTALAQCHRVLEIAERIGEVGVRARAHNLLGITYLRSDSNTAIANFELSFAAYRQAGNLQGQATSHNLIANACFNLGRWSEAEYHYLQAHHTFDQIGDKYNQAIANNNLGSIALNRGQFDNALMFYEGGLQLANAIGASVWMVGVFYMNLGATFVRKGDADTAWNHLQRSRALFEQGKTREFIPELLRHEVEALVLQDDWVRAEELVLMSLALARELDMRSEEGMSLRVYGRIRQALGDGATAVSLLEQSITILQEAEEEYELARSRLALAQLLLVLAQGEMVSVRGLLDEAEATFTRLEAHLDLALVQALREDLR